MGRNIIVLSFLGKTLCEEKINCHVFDISRIQKEYIKRFPECYYVVAETIDVYGKKITMYLCNKNYNSKL